MNQERIKQLITEALELSLFESIEPSVTIESSSGGGRVEIPLAFASNFTKLILREKSNGTT